MNKSKLILTVFVFAFAISGNAQERKMKNTNENQSTKQAPNQVETTEKAMPSPAPATPQAPQASPAPQQTEAAQPMQAVPQSSTNGDKPVEGTMPKQPKDKSKKRELKAKIKKG